MENYTVIHVDDLGMSHAANRGGIEAMEGAATCGSIMVPCPGFDEIVQIGRDRTELDLGCHITLNAEFFGFRWKPLLDDVPSLCDGDGFLWRKARETIAFADPGEVKREMRAQLVRLLDSGVDVTHLDAHMATAMDKAFYRDYVELGLEFDLPTLSLSSDSAGDMLSQHGLRADADLCAELANALGSRGLPIFDFIEIETPWYNPFVAEHHHRLRIGRLAGGRNYFILHSAMGGPELKAFAPDWMQRDSERFLFAPGGALAGEFSARGITTVGMRQLRDEARAGRD